MNRRFPWVVLVLTIVGAGHAGSALGRPGSGPDRRSAKAVSGTSPAGRAGIPVALPVAPRIDTTALPPTELAARAGVGSAPVPGSSGSVAPALNQSPVAAGEKERLVVVAPALAVGRGLASGGPANLQLLTSVALSRLGVLPEAGRDILFDQYARGFEAVTGGSKVFGEFLAGADDASSSLSPIVNPPARAVGGAVVAGGASALDAIGDLGAVGGQGSSFPRWFAATIRQLGAASGVAPPGQAGDGSGG